jgi:hypothetical protein
MHYVRDYSRVEISTNEKFNATHAVTDLAVLRKAVIHWVRTTGQRVLLCPEMSSENELFEPYILSQLPEDVKPHVGALDRYWITDEASSVYARASLVLSMECHSPILAIAAGKPAIYLHQPQDTWKVQMYPDLGLGDWIFPIGEAGDGHLAARMTEIHQNHPAALALAQTAQCRAATLLGNAVRQVLQSVASPFATTK